MRLLLLWGDSHLNFGLPLLQDPLLQQTLARLWRPSPPGITTGAMVCCRLPEGGPGPVGASAGVGVALRFKLP